VPLAGRDRLRRRCGVLLEDVACARHELVDPPRVDRGLVGGHAAAGFDARFSESAAMLIDYDQPSRHLGVLGVPDVGRVHDFRVGQHDPIVAS
jgi:hypothetical protein